MEYFSPKTVSEAFALIRRWKGKAKLIARGTNVIPDRRANVIKTNALVGLKAFHHSKMKFNKNSYPA